MLQLSIEKETSNYLKEIDILREKVKKCEEQYKYFKSPKQVLDEYISLKKKFTLSSNKKRKQLKKRIQSIENDYHFIQADTEKIAHTEKIMVELKEIEKYKTNTEQYVENNIELVLNILKDYGFIRGNQGSPLSPSLTVRPLEKVEIDEQLNLAHPARDYRGAARPPNLTRKGGIATNIQEVHPLVFSELLEKKLFIDLSVCDLIVIFSCFANCKINDEYTVYDFSRLSISDSAKSILKIINEYYVEIRELEINNHLHSREQEMQYNLCEIMKEWCEAKDEASCLGIYKKAKSFGISTGVFIKAVLKINNIASEIEKVCEIIGDLELLDKIKKIPELTLKSLATNQSLYV
tara:strand:+ start:1 stop:1050 length:1050 start_codon:yes stop_codon:yes gene_type:complete